MSIVVGVDGSEPSYEALRFALDEARLRGTGVEAVHAWHYPPLTSMPGVVPPPVFAKADLEAEGRRVLSLAMEKVVGSADPGVPVRRVVVEGPAAAELVDRSRYAELLVVGHRGRDGFLGLLLGSVAQQCATHAHCPVAIVRSADEGEW